jgi:hypothetical protein
MTVGDLRRLLKTEDEDLRAYWIGALMREADTRDVWCFVQPDELRILWPRLVRHLGQTREMWAWLSRLDDTAWPPREAYGG